MITINYDAWVLGPTAYHRVWITARGTTPDEVKADAERQRKAIGAISVEEDSKWGMYAAGIHNNEGDWISAFGPNYGKDCVFGDTPVRKPAAQKKHAWLGKLFS